MFQPVESPVSFPRLEEAISRFWKEGGIYEKSLAARADAPNGPFVFYEGPPTANGLPHPGHCLTRAIKDLFPRYKTMRGYLCRRKAGWDTHGLPVEVEVCKELGIHSKEEIEAFGVEPFIRKCVESVFRYTQQWEQLTERLGFWIHLDEAYVTFHQSYVESVWWALKTLFDRGLLYQGHKIVWWWAQGGTALSSGEVGQGYREVADPSVFVRFPLLDSAPPGLGTSVPSDLTKNTDLLVWTTTPWTLPSNQFAAVKPDLEYSVVSVEGEARKLILASALVETVSAKAGKKFTIEATLSGQQLIGLRYRPPFPFHFSKLGEKQGRLKDGGTEHVAWRVVPADFVTTDTGTGIVHQAPAFGEVDFDLLQSEQSRFVNGEGPSLICSVAPDGTFTAETPEYKGRWVKDCDRDIIRQMKAEGTLFHQEQYRHDYPFCWRAEEDPLIQYPRKSWFIRTTAFKEQMLANNSRINWLPEHIKDGRFGNFLETNVDWALSRERYWGTPLPIWVCEKTGYAEAVASYDELLRKPGLSGTDVWEKAKAENPDLPDDLKVHKPYIDAVTYDSPKAPGSRMRRVTEVIDCWFDSGAMPFAQWGYPNTPGSLEKFCDQFPADFISEALDQTRGWFYSLVAISTLLFAEEGGGLSPFSPEKSELADAGPTAKTGTVPLAADSAKRREDAAAEREAVPFPHPFRNCIVLGLMLGEDGGKMSKSKRNYREPNEVFDRYGADALRWYLFANQPPWTSIRYNEQSIKDCIPEFLLRLWNVYSFFVIYARIDGFDPGAAIRSAGVSPTQLDPEVLTRADGYRLVSDRGELDRWILSELNRTAAAVVERMDAYDNFAACACLIEFVDALSNWYVRRSRDRFWSSGTVQDSADKGDAYWTLYECLLTTCKLIAPFVPFLAEAMWQNLAVCGAGVSCSAGASLARDNDKTVRGLAEIHGLKYVNFGEVAIHPSVIKLMPEAVARENTAVPLSETGGVVTVVVSNPMDYGAFDRLRFRLNRQIDIALASRESILEAIDRCYGNAAVAESVHLCDYPTGNQAVIDVELSERMALAREIVSLGLRARMGAKLKVRQPLSQLEIVLGDATHRDWLEEHGSLICSELNVKRVEFIEKAEQYITYTVLPDLKRLGPKLGKRLPALRKVLAESNGARLLSELQAKGKITLALPDGPVDLDAEEIQVRLQAKEGWAAAQGRSVVVVLDTELTPDLIREGLARELVRVIQDRRKEMGCQFTDRIEIGIVTESPELKAAIDQFSDYIRGETLAEKIKFNALPGVESVETDIGGQSLVLCIKVV
jgi:isoleucyl-tRNA synthetase